MNALTTFDFNANTIRVVEIEGEPWFVAADVCRVLGIQVHPRTGEPNVTVALRSIDADQSTLYPIQGKYGARNAKVISESGLYKLIMRSDKPVARPFQDWVTRVVLPTIRKDGMYVTGEERLDLTNERDLTRYTLQVIDALRLKCERLEREYNFVTVDEWRATRHLYLAHNMRVRLGQVASKIARDRGITLERQTRVVIRSAKEIEVQLNVYPRSVLDEAWDRINKEAY